MVVHLEQEQLFFIPTPRKGYGMTGVQMIRLAVEKMRARGPLYGRTLSLWHVKDAEFLCHWATFCTTIDKHYMEMLA